ATTATTAPASANPSAMALPMPRLPPVTIATLPRSENLSNIDITKASERLTRNTLAINCQQINPLDRLRRTAPPALQAASGTGCVVPAAGILSCLRRQCGGTSCLG